MNVITKTEAQKCLSDVPGQYAFWCGDGMVLKNMKGLQNGLTTMSDKTYLYHSNSEKNDFSNWVQDVIGDQKLANDLHDAKSRAQALTVVNRRVALLEKVLKQD